jgi:RNA-binding protein YlmH
MTRQKRQKTQINKIREEKGDIITNMNEIQRFVREDFENFYKVNWKI